MCDGDARRRGLFAQREALLCRLNQLDAEIASLEIGEGADVADCAQEAMIADGYPEAECMQGERTCSDEELLEAEAGEQREIGRNLYDTFGQHLVGILWLAQVLVENLESEGSAHVADAAKIADVVKETIELTRRLAQKLCMSSEEAR